MTSLNSRCCRPNTDLKEEHFRNFSSLIVLGLNVCLLCQGKQQNFSSKIHYLSLQSPRNKNGLRPRTSLDQVKESKKIDLDIEFINNGRPYRINSKGSKMLNKGKKKRYKTFDDKEVKQLEELNSVGKRVDIPPVSQNLFMKAVKKENSTDQMTVSGHETVDTVTGMIFKQIRHKIFSILD